MRATTVVIAAALIGSSCGAGKPADGGDLTVFAAASLTSAFTELGEAFMAEYSGTDVTFSFAGSSELAAQLREDAPADVFASADLANMDRLDEAGGIVGSPIVFASNVAEIIVEAGNPRSIASVTDLADDDLVVVQCAPRVPCGGYAERVVANAGVSVTPKSFEGNVSGVVTKVALGEADAGIVYRTDVLAAGDRAHGVTIPDEINVVAAYPIAVTANAASPIAAERFVDFLLSDAGRTILETYGFGEP